MSDQSPNARELLAQISEFESTLSNLQKNVVELRGKIIKKRDQFGEDVSKWPGLE